MAVPTLENGNRYAIGVHYWNDAPELGSHDARVRVFFGEELSASPTQARSRLDMWTVGWVDWPTGAFTPCETECVIPDYRHPFLPPPEPPTDLGACPLPWQDHFESSAIDAPTSGSDSWNTPISEDRSSYYAGLAALLDDRNADALELAAELGHLVCSDGDVAVWAPPRGSARPVVAVNRAATTPLIVEAPHAVYDRNTRDEALLAFDTLGAHAVIVSGTHRCASDTISVRWDHNLVRRAWARLSDFGRRPQRRHDVPGRALGAQRGL